MDIRLIFSSFVILACFSSCSSQVPDEQGKGIQEPSVNSTCLPNSTVKALDVIIGDYEATEIGSDIKRLARAIDEIETCKELEKDSAATIVDFQQRFENLGNIYSLPLEPKHFAKGENCSTTDRVFEDSFRLAKYQDLLHLLCAAAFEQGKGESSWSFLDHSLLVNQFQGELGGTSNWLRRCDSTLVNLVAVLRCCSSGDCPPPQSVKKKLEALYDEANTDNQFVRALDWELQSRLVEADFSNLENDKKVEVLNRLKQMLVVNHDLDTIAWSKHPWVQPGGIQNEEAISLDINYPAVLNWELKRRVAIAIGLAAVQSSLDDSLKISEQIRKRIDSLKLPKNCIRYHEDKLFLIQFNEIDTSRELTVFNWIDNTVISYQEER